MIISDMSGKKRGREEEAKEIKNRWLKITIEDPFLPKIFLPQPWHGDEAGKLVRRLAS